MATFSSKWHNTNKLSGDLRLSSNKNLQISPNWVNRNFKYGNEDPFKWLAVFIIFITIKEEINFCHKKSIRAWNTVKFSIEDFFWVIAIKIFSLLTIGNEEGKNMCLIYFKRNHSVSCLHWYKIECCKRNVNLLCKKFHAPPRDSYWLSGSLVWIIFFCFSQSDRCDHLPVSLKLHY